MDNGKEPVLPFGSFLFPRVFQAFRMSIQPTKLILAFMALSAICLTGRVMDVISPSVVVRPDGITELDEYVTQGQVAEHIRLFTDAGEERGVFKVLWNFGAERFHDTLYGVFEFDTKAVEQNIVNCFRALGWAFTWHPSYSVLFFAIVLAVMSLTGGAICRIAALQFAQGEKPGLTEAVRFGIRKFTSFLTAPITPLAIIIVIGASIFLLGLWGNIPVVGELTVGLSLPLAFAAAAIVAVIAIGTIAGFSLMFPTIAYEDSDCFDAISRSFSYVYAKPWRMGFYVVIASIHGAICYMFVRFFSFLLLWITYQFLQLGFLHQNEKLRTIWPEPIFTDFLGSATATPTTAHASVAAFLIYLWVLVVVGLMVAFVISYFFSASTILYALMRNRVDRIALDEVYTYSDEDTADVPPMRTDTEEDPSQEPRPEDSEEPTETSE